MGKFCFVLFFHKRILGCSFCLRVAPHSGRGEWSQHYMCCRSVYSAAWILFWGRSGISLCRCVHTLVRIFIALYMHSVSFTLTR